MSRLTLIDFGQTFVQISLGDADLVTQISLGDGQDVIAWEWTANEEYSSKSAYTARSMPLRFGRREFFLEKGL